MSKQISELSSVLSLTNDDLFVVELLSSNGTSSIYATYKTTLSVGSWNQNCSKVNVSSDNWDLASHKLSNLNDAIPGEALFTPSLISAAIGLNEYAKGTIPTAATFTDASTILSNSDNKLYVSVSGISADLSGALKDSFLPKGNYLSGLANSATLGGIKLGYTANGRTFPVLTYNELAYVSVSFNYDLSTNYTSDATGTCVIIKNHQIKSIKPTTALPLRLTIALNPELLEVMATDQTSFDAIVVIDTTTSLTPYTLIVVEYGSDLAIPIIMSANEEVLTETISAGEVVMFTITRIAVNTYLVNRMSLTTIQQQ